MTIDAQPISEHPYFGDGQPEFVLSLIWQHRNDKEARILPEYADIYDLIGRMLRVVQYQCENYDPKHELPGFEEDYVRVVGTLG